MLRIYHSGEIVAIAVDVQLRAEITLTGSDDTWACATGGWKLINASEADVAQGVLLEGDGPNRDVESAYRFSDLVKRPTLSFLPHQQQFIQALSHARWKRTGCRRSMAVVLSEKDHRSRILANVLLSMAPVQQVSLNQELQL